jgi:hypothetical protein
MKGLNMGLKEQVKKGLVSLDEAIELTDGWNQDIRGWLLRRKKGNVKAPKETTKKKKKGKKKRAKL